MEDIEYDISNHFCNRILNALVRANICSFGEIEDYYKRHGSLKCIRNIGEKTEQEIIHKMKELGYIK